MRIKAVTLLALCACAFACGLAAIPAAAQKVDVTVDPSANFKKYKRYAWGKNSLVTRQTADVEAKIEKKIEAAADQQLASKGFVLDPAHPDFVIHYDAGAIPDPDTAAATWSQPIYGGDYVLSGTFSGVPMDVWLQATALVKFAVQDASSKNVVWQSVLKKKADPQKFMRDLDGEINKLVAKSLQKFPPK